MDFYDKTKSTLGNSSLTPAPTQVNATGTPEFPTCDSDIYLAYEQAPTREIMAAIIGGGLTPDATDLTQLFQVIQAIAGAGTITELVQNKDLSHSSSGAASTNQLDAAFAKTLANTFRIQGESHLPMGSTTAKVHNMIIRWSFFKVSTGPDVWDWTIISSVAAGSAGATSESNSGVGLVASLPNQLPTGVAGSNVTYSVTLLDNIVRGLLTFNNPNFFEHNIVADIF